MSSSTKFGKCRGIQPNCGFIFSWRRQNHRSQTSRAWCSCLVESGRAALLNNFECALFCCINPRHLSEKIWLGFSSDFCSTKTTAILDMLKWIVFTRDVQTMCRRFFGKLSELEIWYLPQSKATFFVQKLELRHRGHLRFVGEHFQESRKRLHFSSSGWGGVRGVYAVRAREIQLSF